MSQRKPRPAKKPSDLGFGPCTPPRHGPPEDAPHYSPDTVGGLDSGHDTFSAQKQEQAEAKAAKKVDIQNNADEMHASRYGETAPNENLAWDSRHSEWIEEEVIIARVFPFAVGRVLTTQSN